MKFEIHHYHHHQNDLEPLMARVAALEKQGGLLMSLPEDLQAIQDQMTQTEADIAAERVEVQGKIAGVNAQVATLTQQVADLQAQATNGGNVTPAQIQAIKDGLTKIDASVKDISEPLPAPAPDAPAS